MNVINLHPHYAKAMTDMKGLVKIYQTHNVGGKFDEAISKYEAYYDSLMDQVLER